MSERLRVVPVNPAMQKSRAMRLTLSIGAVAMVLIGLALLYLLMEATNNTEMNERNYARLLVVNVVVASTLFGAIVWVGYRLAVRLREGRFGSRLLVKLATIFALVGLAPGMLIYVVSYQFVSRSIESWFDVKVEGALEAGLNLGRVMVANALAVESANREYQERALAREGLKRMYIGTLDAEPVSGGVWRRAAGRVAGQPDRAAAAAAGRRCAARWPPVT
jgi:hypothetical protein